MPKTTPRRALIKWAGYVLVAACLVFVGIQGYAHYAVLGQALSTPGVLRRLGATSLLYAGLFFLVAGGWHVLLKGVSGQISFRNSCYIYTKTSIGKYLPGNIGHFLGRHMVASQFGLPQSSVAIGTGLEILCQVVAALVIGLWGEFPLVPPVSPIVGVLLAGGVLLCAPFVIIKIARRKGVALADNRAYRRIWESILLAIGLNAVFFLATGVLIHLLSGQTNVGSMTFVSVYAVAWFLGTATPGAPAGAGVREAAMTAMLGGVMGTGEALAVSLLFRFTTTLGDVLFFLSSFFLSPRRQHENTNKAE